MVTNKATLEKIREIIERHYNRLMISVVGEGALSIKELKELETLGIDTSNPDSLMSLVYHHNFINYPLDEKSPKTIEDMKAQQGTAGLKPEGTAHEYTVENVNDKTKQYIEKLKLDVMTKLESIIRENNDSYKMNALQNLDREDMLDELMKESSLGKLKQKLRDTAGDGNRDWNRIAITEISNALGIGSVDRIIADHRGEDVNGIYVFRVTVKDAKTCKWCRRFYDDRDGSPKLYKLSTLLNNGSNYGRKTDSWQPVVGATHPNERCSQMIELKPGFKLQSDGNVTYIGLDKWQDYLSGKLQK